MSEKTSSGDAADATPEMHEAGKVCAAVTQTEVQATGIKRRVVWLVAILALVGVVCAQLWTEWRKAALSASGLDVEWPLQMSSSEESALLARNACAGGVKISGICTPLDVTSITLTTAEGGEALALLQELKSIMFVDDSLAGDQGKIWDALRHLPHLAHLDVRGAALSDVGPISNLQGLWQVELSRTTVQDIGPLSHLPRLEVFRANYSQISDLSPLTGLPRLSQLWLEGSRSITSIDPLSKVAGLEVLMLRDTGVTDIEALREANALRSLDLTGLSIRDLSPLVELPALKWLALSVDAFYGTRAEVEGFLGTLKSGP